LQKNKFVYLENYTLGSNNANDFVQKPEDDFTPKPEEDFMPPSGYMTRTRGNKSIAEIHKHVLLDNSNRSISSLKQGPAKKKRSIAFGEDPKMRSLTPLKTSVHNVANAKNSNLASRLHQTIEKEISDSRNRLITHKYQLKPNLK